MRVTANRTKGWDAGNAAEWQRAEQTVRNLRQRIFRASREGDHRKVRSLQRLMLKSRSNRRLSIRQVTQLNTGRNTPGVDRRVAKTPEARRKLERRLAAAQPWKASPVRRVYIPKANGKQRPLGIPTIADRAMQAIVKNALEPEWEARFEPCSYGFRPGRGCHDAIARIFNLVRPKGNKRWVLDADIKGAFDNIRHETILEAVAGFPALQLLKQWLKAGFLEEGRLVDTATGTPQGGVISPLLANIALHGLEEAAGVRYSSANTIRGPRAVVRYADDFVVIGESRKDIEAARDDVARWLAVRGLELSPEKTRIRHVTEGFNFLGFNVRLYKAPMTSRSGYKLLIKPSPEAMKRFRLRVKQEWLALRGHNLTRVLATINPILRGWSNYYRTVVSKVAFGRLDHWTFGRIVRWIRYSHPNKPWWWARRQYFGQLRKGSKDQWVFGDPGTGRHLLRMAWTPIRRHALVPYDASPDDPTLRDYWTAREQARHLARRSERDAAWPA